MTTSSIIMDTLYKLSSLVLPNGPLSNTPTAATKVAIDNGISSSFLTPLTSLLHTNSHISTTSSFYELQTLISALSIFFCRLVIINGSLTSSPDGHTSVFGHSSLEFILRLSMSCLLFTMVLLNFNYDIICSVELWSHLVPGLIGWFVGYMNKRGKKVVDEEPLIKAGIDGKVTPTKVKKKKKDSMKSNNMPKPSLTLSIGIALIILLSPPLCLYTCRLFSNPTFLSTLIQNTPNYISNTLQYMFPLSELSASYTIICSFVSDKELLHDMIVHLLFVTFHIQVSLGHIGIAFLTSEQRRKNMLIRMDVDEKEDTGGSSGKKEKNKGKGEASKEKKKKFDPSAKFRRSAPTFILFTVLPYMFQIILFGK